MTELAAAVKASAATEEASVVLQTARQQVKLIKKQLNNRVSATFIDALERKAPSVLLTVRATDLSLQLRRETVKGAVVSERGDPLLLNICK